MKEYQHLFTRTIKRPAHEPYEPLGGMVYKGVYGSARYAGSVVQVIKTEWSSVDKTHYVHFELPGHGEEAIPLAEFRALFLEVRG